MTSLVTESNWSRVVQSELLICVSSYFSPFLFFFFFSVNHLATSGLKAALRFHRPGHFSISRGGGDRAKSKPSRQITFYSNLPDTLGLACCFCLASPEAGTLGSTPGVFWIYPIAKTKAEGTRGGGASRKLNHKQGWKIILQVRRGVLLSWRRQFLCTALAGDRRSEKQPRGVRGGPWRSAPPPPPALNKGIAGGKSEHTG